MFVVDRSEKVVVAFVCFTVTHFVRAGKFGNKVGITARYIQAISIIGNRYQLKKIRTVNTTCIAKLKLLLVC